MKDRLAKAKEQAKAKALEHAKRAVPDDETRERLLDGAARVGRAAKDAALDDVTDGDGKVKKGKVLRRAVMPVKTVRKAAEGAKEAARDEVRDIALESWRDEPDAAPRPEDP